MKKSFFLIVCLFCCCMLVGCYSNSSTLSSSPLQNNSSIQTTTTHSQLIKSNSITDATYLDNNSLYEKNISIKALFDDKLFLEVTRKESDDDKTSDIIYQLYNIENNSFKKIGELMNKFLSSNDFAIVNNHIYSAPVLEKETNQNVLSDIDCNNGNVSIIKGIRFGSTVMPSIVSCYKLNESEFVIFEPVLLESKETKNNSQRTYSYRIKKYNTITKRITNLLEYQYDSDQQIGTYIASVYSVNNLIYTYTVESKQQNQSALDYSIRIFNTEGTLTKTISLKEIFPKFLQNDYNQEDFVMDIGILGNYIYFQTALNKNLILNLNTLQQVEIPDFNNWLMINTYSDSNNRYVYFQNINDLTLGVFDKETGKFKKLTIAVDDKFKYLSHIVTDNKGNIVIKLYDRATDQKDFRYYYVNSAEIETVFNNID